MTTPRPPALSALLLAAALTCRELPAQNEKETAIPEKYLQGTTGAFVLYDQKADRYLRYNVEECGKRYSPASTFKILNAIIGLETKVIPDENYVIPWDSIPRANPAWNRDHNLATAVANSVVWYFQDLARKVGPQRMKIAVTLAEYGNCNISGGIDKFWLGSTLAISANEQVEFLRMLYSDSLPFSRRSMRIVKEIIVLERTDDHVLRGKTGFSTSFTGRAVAWFVGYVEKKDNVYFFAFNMSTFGGAKTAQRIFDNRKTYALAILKDLGVL
jgi:beta-lactamase class D